jgi:hypothetical protein
MITADAQSYRGKWTLFVRVLNGHILMQPVSNA